MDKTINVTTRYCDSEIRQSVGINGGISDRAERIIQLQDEGVIHALKEVGWLPPVESKRLLETARLAERFANAKGRHHSQQAMCDLMDLFGKPCVHPSNEEPKIAPEAWMYQHEETGQIGFVDQWQIDNGFEKHNPRLHVICPLYRHPPS